jgi:Lar family restriction alleviation protein
MSAELLPCPYCGAAAHLHLVREGPLTGYHYIECENPQCGASSVALMFAEAEQAKEKLAERWNRRRDADTPIEALPMPAKPQFPTALRKMWSGTEVQKWIDEHWVKPSSPGTHVA